MTEPSATIQIVSFPVEGMTCASCVSRVTHSLRKVNGVQAAKVNLANESATVRFDPALTDIESLAGAVESAGYAARVDQIDFNEMQATASPAVPRSSAGSRPRAAIARVRSRMSAAIHRLMA